MFKTVLVLAKSAYFIFISLKGAMKWNGQPRAQALLVASAGIVALVTGYKFLMNKEIGPLVFLQGLSMWSTTAVVPALMSLVGKN